MDAYEIAVSNGVTLAEIALWRCCDIVYIAQPRQVEVSKSRNENNFDIWDWIVAGKHARVESLVKEWDCAHSHSSLFNPANLVCSCRIENRDMCKHKAATMIVASINPAAVAKAMGYRSDIASSPVLGLLASGTK